MTRDLAEALLLFILPGMLTLLPVSLAVMVVSRLTAAMAPGWRWALFALAVAACIPLGYAIFHVAFGFGFYLVCATFPSGGC